MINSRTNALSRRAMGKLALGIGAAAIAERVAAALPFGAVDPAPGIAPILPVPQPAPVATPKPVGLGGVPPALMHRALAALQQHVHQIPHLDRIALVDFSAASSEPRLHLVNLATQETTSLLVAHGSGSDPAHTGWLQMFSNQEGSNASSSGAYVATDYYVGKHGRSQRLIGLDQSNNNALDRAIVVHSAWYANPDIVAKQGMLGRSEGCFAVGEQDLETVFARLGQGRMIYADKIGSATTA